VAQIARRSGPRHSASPSSRRSRQVPHNYFPPGITVHHRRRWKRFQRNCARQGCRADLRPDLRRGKSAAAGKRGSIPTPPTRLHQRPVCEAAATARKPRTASRCSRSETEFGRSGRSTSRTATRTIPAVTASARACHRPWRKLKADRDVGGRFPANVRRPAVTPAPKARRALQHPGHGIGGPGINIGALLGMPHHLDGPAARRGFTGLAQKNGP